MLPTNEDRILIRPHLLLLAIIALVFVALKTDYTSEVLVALLTVWGGILGSMYVSYLNKLEQVIGAMQNFWMAQAKVKTCVKYAPRDPSQNSDWHKSFTSAMDLAVLTHMEIDNSFEGLLLHVPKQKVRAIQHLASNYRVPFVDKFDFLLFEFKANGNIKYIHDILNNAPSMLRFDESSSQYHSICDQIRKLKMFWWVQLLFESPNPIDFDSTTESGKH